MFLVRARLVSAKASFSTLRIFIQMSTAVGCAAWTSLPRRFNCDVARALIDLFRDSSRGGPVARPIWRGSLSFGLVAIPVQMHTAVREHRPKFRLLHAKDKSPIKYERVCQRDGKPVGWEDLVKGYEYERGRYVVLTKDDFKAAAVEKDRRVQVSDFVPAEAIDDRYFDQPYYLLPDKGGEHAYAVFQQALAEAGRVGIGKVVMREKQHLVAVESIEGRLVITMLRYADEVVDAPEVSGLDRIKVPPKELKLATDLIDALATDWEPEKY